MLTPIPTPKQTISEKISAGLHVITIAMVGLFSLAATLHVAMLLA
jgi:hypothetical protein